MMVLHRQAGGRYADDPPDPPTAATRTGKARSSWEHKKFPDLLSYLRAGDLMVMNNADADLIPFDGKLVPPLPPYIKRKKRDNFTEEDFQRYRTVYAQVPGSKAAPTAGFHFSEEILGKIRRLDVETKFLTLHISYDTYKSIRSRNVLEHPIETAAAVTKAKKEGRRVIAVGTTVVRGLESWALNMGGITSLFITPGFSFKIADALLTNFHRPRSTVLVMVSAFAGRDLILPAYQEALQEKYRLFSYGDAMLIL